MKGFAVMVSTVASRYALAYAMLAVVACNEGPNNGRTAVRADAADTSSAEESMSQAEQDRRVDYIEFTATDIERTKQFYSEVFGWEFTDYGPDYSSFSDGRLAGGFTVAAEVSAGGPLVVLYSTNLEEIATRIRDNGGQIVREIFEFPGGRRFHFTDPSGNELAVWSDR
jgi:predicted enzyme related to lactoylglutathione lyase